MSMIYCAECGSPASPEAPYCPKCGHPLQAPPPNEQPGAQQPAPAPVVNVTVTQAQTQTVAQGVAGKRWSPLLAGILSFIIPGLGQLYKRQPINGVVWFLAVGVGYVLFIIPGLILHICCVIGAAMGDPYK